MPTGLVMDCETSEVSTENVPALPLADRKELVWAQAKCVRDAKIDKGVNVPGLGVFDSDTVSRSNITGAVTMALIAKMAGQPFSMGWKLQNNSVVQVSSADAMIAVGVAVGQHVAACHEVAQTVGGAIQAATAQALDAIDIGAGYP